MKFFRCVAIVASAAMLTLAIAVQAQDTAPPPPNAAPAAAPPLSQDLLDSLLAPIALYPDQLLTQVLMASTYPLEVVEAARFVKANPNLKGTALDDALKDKTWDPSVLSLAAFPQVLDMMNEHLDWTQRLGDAFLDDEAGVMRTVQSLRLKAQQAGNLQSTEQQNVVVQEKTIIIEPAQPQYVYVPVYNPTVIYGAWWAPAYRPWFWYPPPIWGYPPYSGAVAAGIFWGTAWAITANNWGWCRPNWGGNSININVNNNNVWVNRPQYHNRYAQNGNWNHNVEHRRGVAYRDTATGNKYRPTNNAGVQTRENYRGRDNVAGTMDRTPGSAGNPTRPSPGANNNVARPSPGTNNNVARPSPGTNNNVTRPSPGTNNNVTRPSPGTNNNVARPSPGTNNNVARPSPGTNNNLTRPSPGAGGNQARPSPQMPATRPSAPPASRPAQSYTSESRPQVQREANRGAQSRAAAQSSQQAAPQRAAPSANRGGGGGGGQGRGR